jgi:hypothetical protein
MKIKFVIYTLLITGLQFSTLLSCKKDILKIIPTITSTSVTNITAISATFSSEITSDGGSSVITRGFCWSTNLNPTIEDNIITNGTGMGNFSSTITGLNSGITYYLRAYAVNSVGTAYSNKATFTTLALAPVLTTIELSNITFSSVYSGGNITSDGGAAVTSRGVCWSIKNDPTITDNKTTDGIGAGNFTSFITGLTPGITFYIRAYASNSIGIGYGNIITFTPIKSIPELITKNITNVCAIGANTGGFITSEGGGIISNRGVCWSDKPNPTINDQKGNIAEATADFSVSITNARPNTTYYLRAFATNEIGTGYGDLKTFTSSEAAYYESFETGTSFNGWRGNFRLLNYNNGAHAMGCRPVSPGGWESFSTTLSTSGQIYFSYGISGNRGYLVFDIDGIQIPIQQLDSISFLITVSAGPHTFYWSFGCHEGPGLFYNCSCFLDNIIIFGDNLTTTTVTVLPLVGGNLESVTATAAICDGYIICDGGGSITSRGVCWSTLENPTIADNKTNEGTGVESFISRVTGLTSNTVYYLKFYATNIAGTVYSEQKKITTLP